MKKIEELNKNYRGKIEPLEGEEKDYYTKQLNVHSWENYEPYAIRRSTNDLICRYDNAHSFSDKLFVSIKKPYQKEKK